MLYESADAVFRASLDAATSALTAGTVYRQFKILSLFSSIPIH